MTSQISNLVLHTATELMGLFAIMNPIANTSIFIGPTAGDDTAATREEARLPPPHR